MSNGKEYTEFELELSGELRALKEIWKANNEKMDLLNETLKDYCKRNEENHSLLWSKHDDLKKKIEGLKQENIDEFKYIHGKFKWIYGVGVGVTGVIGVIATIYGFFK